MKKTTISLADLLEREACSEQVDLFIALFGEEPVDMTPELCERHCEVLDFRWGAYHFLTQAGFGAYCRLVNPTNEALGHIRNALYQEGATIDIRTLRRRATYRHRLAVQALAFGTVVQERGLAGRDERTAFESDFGFAPLGGLA